MSGNTEPVLDLFVVGSGINGTGIGKPSAVTTSEEEIAVRRGIGYPPSR